MKSNVLLASLIAALSLYTGAMAQAASEPAGLSPAGSDAACAIAPVWSETAAISEARSTLDFIKFLRRPRR